MLPNDETFTESETTPSPGSGALQLEPIAYRNLNAVQQESFNFQKLSAVLADFGYITMRLSDDWKGADFIAQHVSGHQFLPVQLKGRVYFGKKYQSKGIYIAFFKKPHWYLYPHDEVLAQMHQKKPKMFETVAWKERGGYSFSRLDPVLSELLLPYRVPKAIDSADEPIEIPADTTEDDSI
jgi:hypothetical protein